MRRARSTMLTLLAVVLGASGPCAFAQAAPAGQTVDRIVARVEGDILLLSEVRELAAYQQLMEGRSQPQDQLINALIEQWAVRNEAQAARFPASPAADVDAEVNRIQSGFPTVQAFRDRLAAAGLTPQELRHIVERQLYLERYLDYKFRPAVQIDDAAIEDYYQHEFVPALRAQGQTPPLDEVRDRIREVLTQRGITARADQWFDETKSRLQIEIIPPPAVEGKP